MKTNMCLFFCLMALLVFCKKEMDEDLVNDYHLQQVNAGSHYCNIDRTAITSFTSSEFLAYVKLDTSLLVHGEQAFQSKLCGFYEDDIHTNSARISYQTITGPTLDQDTLSLKLYVYNNGERNLTENLVIKRLSRVDILSMLQSDGFLKISIKVTPTNYVFQIDNDPPMSTVRTIGTAVTAKKYLANHYYGGPDEIYAPHDMKMWIKFDAIMLE